MNDTIVNNNYSSSTIDNKLNNFIIQTLEKCIHETRNVNELSERLRIGNICKIVLTVFFFLL